MNRRMETSPYLGSLKEASLIILENQKIKIKPLRGKIRWSFGRETPKNHPDITVQSAIISRDHGEFLNIGEKWYFKDHHSHNGTYHNGTKIREKETGEEAVVELRDGDVLRVDSSDLSFVDPQGILMIFSTSISGENDWKTFDLSGQDKVTIGREKKESQIILPSNHVSSKHAQIRYLNGSYYISDCKSRNGTWVNGKKLETSMILKERDTIAICEYCLFFLDGKLIYNTGKKAGGKALEVEIRSKSVPNQNGFGMIRLLEDIHLEIEQNTLVALLGGSGAGKSTLMDCMNGMEYSGVDGNVWMNGENLYENFERLKYQIGSVPQEPVLHKDYIVEKELRDAALLRLPGDTKKEEINKKVDDVLKWLNLCHVRKSKIKNISGGEKKRVNIGIELVADRSVLYLDEPDAGLDPKSVKELTVLLRDLAHQQGKTIIVIIHNIIEVDRYDQVIFMAKGGKVAFSGSPQAAKKYFKVENLKDAYEKVSNIGL